MFEVPLFIDNYGDKRVLTDFPELEEIVVDLDVDVIAHVTHKEESERILCEGLQPSDNRNILPGCWFGISTNGNLGKSVYGSCSFSSTLRKLERHLHTGNRLDRRRLLLLRQGEIVSYKGEVNVILYVDNRYFAHDVEVLRKPSAKSAQELLHNVNAYVHVSIFIQEKYLPSTREQFLDVFQPGRVVHGDFCVKQTRTPYTCTELAKEGSTDDNDEEPAAKVVKADDVLPENSTTAS